MCVEGLEARWFLLPGIYYDDEYGIVGSITFISESINKERLEVRLEYFGEDEGQAKLNLFLPRQSVEWTFNGRYQVSEQKGYSALKASDQNELCGDTRYWTDLLLRCDFPRDDGFFYGLEGAYRRYEFGRGSDDAYFVNTPASVAQMYSEGEEYCASLRVGIERRDDRYNTSRGHYFLWQFDLGRSRTGRESRQLVRTQVDFRRYLPLMADKSILALNFRGGVIHHQVPYFSRFKMGGFFSLRGFPLDRYSGNAYYLFRTEFRQVIKSNIPTPLNLLKKVLPDFEDHKFSVGLVLFTDFGDLWRDDLGWWGLRQDVGAGLRAIFPPSVVASLDVATPTDSDHITVYLNLQQSF